MRSGRSPPATSAAQLSSSQPASSSASSSDRSTHLRAAPSGLRTRINPLASERARLDRFFGRSSHSKYGLRPPRCPDGQPGGRECDGKDRVGPSAARGQCAHRGNHDYNRALRLRHSVSTPSRGGVRLGSPSALTHASLACSHSREFDTASHSRHSGDARRPVSGILRCGRGLNIPHCGAGGHFRLLPEDVYVVCIANRSGPRCLET